MLKTDFRKVLRYFVIMAISILGTTNFIGIFMPANQTKIVINYNISEESGNIQLFYRQDEQDFSEERSISSRISEDGRTVFEIPQTDINELRIDTDDIKIFRIKSIELSKIGYTLTINSENWADYYRAQYDMDSLFDDNSLISYKATGIDPYIVFGISEYSKNTEEQLQYYLLLCIGSVICFFVICFIIKIIERKGGTTKENAYVIIRYICFVLVFIQVFHIDLEVIKSINERKQIGYMVHISGAEPVLASEELTCKFIVHGKELLSQQFFVRSLESVSGSIKYQIIDQNGNVLADTVESLQNVLRVYNREWDAIVINCEELDLKFGQEYEICMQIESDSPIYFIMNSSGEIQQRQTMRFIYGKLYISIIVIISCVLLIILFWICRHGFNPNIFLSFAVVLGVISCFVLTPCTADDEYRHFLRVYDIVSADTAAYNSMDFSEAKGNVIVESQGASLLEVPYELNRLRMVDVDANYDNISYDAEMNYQACPDEVIRLLFKSNSGKTSVVSIIATKSASILAYLPQVVLAIIGKCLGMNAVGVYYMARVGNMLFAVFIAYICMRMLPNHKNIFLLLHFAPNAFWISVSCNRDSVITSLAMLGVAYIIYIKEKKKIMNLKRIIFITVLFSIIAIIKLPYVLLISTLLLLGPDNYPYITSNYRRRLAEVGIAFIVFVISVGSYKINSDMETIIKMFTEHAQVKVIVANEESAVVPQMTHLSYALEHPKEVIEVLWRRYKIIFTEDLHRSIEGYRYPIGKIYFWLVIAALIFSNKVLRLGQRIYMLTVFMITWFSIIVVGYTLMPPDYGSVWGINPRYMIPILFPFALVICSGNEKTDKLVDATVPIVVLGMAAMNIVSMITAYY